MMKRWIFLFLVHPLLMQSMEQYEQTTFEFDEDSSCPLLAERLGEEIIPEPLVKKSKPNEQPLTHEIAEGVSYIITEGITTEIIKIMNKHQVAEEVEKKYNTIITYKNFEKPLMPMIFTSLTDANSDARKKSRSLLPKINIFSRDKNSKKEDEKSALNNFVRDTDFYLFAQGTTTPITINTKTIQETYFNDIVKGNWIYIEFFEPQKNIIILGTRDKQIGEIFVQNNLHKKSAS